MADLCGSHLVLFFAVDDDVMALCSTLIFNKRVEEGTISVVSNRNKRVNVLFFMNYYSM